MLAGSNFLTKSTILEIFWPESIMLSMIRIFFLKNEQYLMNPNTL